MRHELGGGEDELECKGRKQGGREENSKWGKGGKPQKARNVCDRNIK